MASVGGLRFATLSLYLVTVNYAGSRSFCRRSRVSSGNIMILRREGTTLPGRVHAHPIVLRSGATAETMGRDKKVVNGSSILLKCSCSVKGSVLNSCRGIVSPIVSLVGMGRCKDSCVAKHSLRICVSRHFSCSSCGDCRSGLSRAGGITSKFRLGLNLFGLKEGGGARRAFGSRLASSRGIMCKRLGLVLGGSSFGLRTSSKTHGFCTHRYLSPMFLEGLCSSALKGVLSACNRYVLAKCVAKKGTYTLCAKLDHGNDDDASGRAKVRGDVSTSFS